MFSHWDWSASFHVVVVFLLFCIWDVLCKVNANLKRLTSVLTREIQRIRDQDGI